MTNNGILRYYITESIGEMHRERRGESESKRKKLHPERRIVSAGCSRTGGVGGCPEVVSARGKGGVPTVVCRFIVVGEEMQG